MWLKKIKGTHISEHRGHKELSLQNEMVEFLTPKEVFIPLVEQGIECTPSVNVGDYVKIGQVIAMKPGRFTIPMHASISGTVVSINKKVWHSSFKMVPSIQIENDFQEVHVETEKIPPVKEMTKEQMIDILRNCGIVGLGGSGFPTYAKFNSSAPIEYIIINGVECEPYISDDYMMIYNRLDKIISGIKYMMQLASSKYATIAIKENKKTLIEKLNKALENEENIFLTLVKDEYPAGWEKYIVQRVTKKTYNALPSEVGAIVNNVSTALAICNALENNMPLIEKTITLTGKGLNTPKNVYVKIGTRINEIVAHIGGYNESAENAYFIAGGPMTGKSIPSDTMIVNRSLTSIIVMPKFIDETVYNCLGCGKCGERCPAFLSPIQIKKAYESKDKKTVEELKANRCMQCGLCSYICPSRIELTETVAKAKMMLTKK